MPPYEMLYGRKCRTPVCWKEVRSRELASMDVVLATTEKIETIRERLKAAQDRWKSYADNRRRPIEFNVGDFVMLKVSPWKGVLRFKNKGKLSPRFIGPFKILKRVGEVAYVLELPEEMRGRKSRQLCNKEIPLVKVQWKHRKGTSIRWEPEEKMRIRFEWYGQRGWFPENGSNVHKGSVQKMGCLGQGKEIRVYKFSLDYVASIEWVVELPFNARLLYSIRFECPILTPAEVGFSYSNTSSYENDSYTFLLNLMAMFNLKLCSTDFNSREPVTTISTSEKLFVYKKTFNKFLDPLTQSLHSYNLEDEKYDNEHHLHSNVSDHGQVCRCFVVAARMIPEASVNWHLQRHAISSTSFSSVRSVVSIFTICAQGSLLSSPVHMTSFSGCDEQIHNSMRYH
ncbi:hypothetical protein Tco_0628292 [Tanacetum coccineum]|uniref:Tf2-1-like SH3-like domain-containing protein n=1 Tax=Tanacetum coccineum TaxID=301880 RepID=A0ABQ4WPV4_9ASTR